MAKWDSLRKTSRDEALINYYATHPDLSLREIGKIFGVTRQRVSQVILLQEKKLGHKITRSAIDAVSR